VVVPDEALTGERLRVEAAGLRDDARRTPIAVAARQLGRPQAGLEIAAALLELAEASPA
jgi:hypothetical protein